jgi:hypothetical protein
MHYLTILRGCTSSGLNLKNCLDLFFYILQDTLWDDALLHIALLTDPIEMSGKRNLTIKALPELCEEDKLRARVTELVAQAVSASAFARDWRNRHIGTETCI